jgi:DMSO/TMAO reductase YedYZ molybdopterin-dependent catalytic subunit
LVLRWWVAALVGVLAMGSAITAGMLVAGFVGADASPFVAVGDEVAKLAPTSGVEFAIKNLGTNDKTFLFIVLGVVLFLLGIVAGLVSRRRAWPGMVIALALGVVGFITVLGRPDLGQLAFIAPLGSMLAGVVVFGWLHGVALTTLPSTTVESPQLGDSAFWTGADDPADSARPEAADEPHSVEETHRIEAAEATDADYLGPGRRRFIISSASVAVGAVAVGLAGQALGSGAANTAASRNAVGPLLPAVPAPSVPAGADFAADGTPSFVTSGADFYRIDTALSVPQVTADSWTLRIHGMVDRELTFHYADIRNRPLVERPITLCCVSNPVGGPYISNAYFLGVPLRDLLNEAGVHPDADQLLSTSVDGFTAGTPAAAVLDPNRGALLAIGMNGQPLPVEHGFPARLVVPGLYGYVSATKWVTDLKLTTFAADQAYWVPRGYSVQAPIKTESRIDAPISGATVHPGQLVVAGIAWAQHKGIAKVEVRVDGGPWQAASLSTEVSKDTWRMWRATVSVRPGSHQIEARATDQTGYTQTTATADTIPDGATGLPGVSVTAR